MHDLVFLPIVVFAVTAIGAVSICLVIDLRERKRILRLRRLSSRRYSVRPVLVHSNATRRQSELT